MTYSVDGIRPETRAAIEAVERGLELARSGVGAQDITSKGGRDFVTATDIGVEDVVRGIVGPRRSMLGQGLSSLPKQVGPSLTLRA
jgi:hypothetical protein